ncbi:hypothetical protein SH661x_000453 [Planctomicrobium sp. SH661]|uniref:hypothetical protein n=1 Tax=Planctomicrobium sp. SH661 TaxID=3448124 RepID=UPI003F5BC85E
MADSNINSLLNDLLIELHRSLAQYASEAWPWTTDRSEELQGAVLSVAEHQREDAGRLAHLLKSRGHYIDFGVYPHEYTSLHYVALEFLFSHLKANQQDLVRWIEETLPALQGDSEAETLVRQIVVSEREALQKLNAVTLPGGPQSIVWMK